MRIYKQNLKFIFLLALPREQQMSFSTHFCLLPRFFFYWIKKNDKHVKKMSRIGKRITLVFIAISSRIHTISETAEAKIWIRKSILEYKYKVGTNVIAFMKLRFSSRERNLFEFQRVYTLNMIFFGVEISRLMKSQLAFGFVWRRALL